MRLVHELVPDPVNALTEGYNGRVPAEFSSEIIVKALGKQHRDWSRGVKPAMPCN